MGNNMRLRALSCLGAGVVTAGLSGAAVAAGNETDVYEQRLKHRGSIALTIEVPEEIHVHKTLKKGSHAEKRITRDHIAHYQAALHLDDVKHTGHVATPWGTCTFKYHLHDTDQGTVSVKCPSIMGNGVGMYSKDDDHVMHLSVTTKKGFKLHTTL